MADCPTLSFLTAVLAAQKPAQAKIVTCHGKDILMPYGQIYSIKNSSLRISDPHFGPAGCHYGFSLPAGWQNHCCQAEEVDSAD